MTVVEPIQYTMKMLGMLLGFELLETSPQAVLGKEKSLQPLK